MGWVLGCIFFGGVWSVECGRDGVVDCDFHVISIITSHFFPTATG